MNTLSAQRKTRTEHPPASAPKCPWLNSRAELARSKMSWLACRQFEAEDREVIDGDIPFGSFAAGLLRFTPERFSDESHLSKRGGSIWIWVIESKRKGNFRELVQEILNLGFAAKVANPNWTLMSILQRNNYRNDGPDGEMVWVLPPNEKGQP